MSLTEKPYRSQMVANYFLSLAEEGGDTISPMKLQKLVYFAHGWHLAIVGEPLIRDPVEAWEYGPVIPALYQDTKRYGRGAVSEKLTLRDPSTFLDKQMDVPEDDKETRDLLNEVWEVYGKYSATGLSDITHMPGTPWYQTYADYNFALPLHADIKTERIKDYFDNLSKGS